MMHPPKDRLGLTIQQPWAELILRGAKTIERRAVPTQQRGTIYLYASRRLSRWPAALQAMEDWSLESTRLPRGCIVGTVQIVDCRPAAPSDATRACLREDPGGGFSWLLDSPERWAEPQVPPLIPYGMWFYPFERKSPVSRRRRRHGGD